MFVVGMGAVLIVARLRGLGSSAPRKIPTALRLQFYPHNINPAALETENIWSWYALCTIVTALEPPSAQYPQGRQISHRQWSIFLVFDTQSHLGKLQSMAAQLYRLRR
jgi:hypothetical protein